MRVKIYVEGGGDTGELKRRCRQGFGEFIRKAGLEGRMPSIVACGSRRDAFEDFRTAIGQLGPDQFLLLLVDSEEPIDSDDTRWEHVSKLDGWTRPARAGEEGLHLMVQCMEAWLVADRECLNAYYGQRFREGSLPRRGDVENIAKADLYKGLANATRHCTKGRYGKGRHSFGILARVDPHKIIAASPHAKRLIDTLRAKSGRSTQ